MWLEGFAFSIFSLSLVKNQLMQEEGKTLDQRMLVPDLWQQEALRYLRDGMAVVLHAPPGAAPANPTAKSTSGALNRLAKVAPQTTMS